MTAPLSVCLSPWLVVQPLQDVGEPAGEGRPTAALDLLPRMGTSGRRSGRSSSSFPVPLPPLLLRWVWTLLGRVPRLLRLALPCITHPPGALGVPVCGSAALVAPLLHVRVIVRPPDGRVAVDVHVLLVLGLVDGSAGLVDLDGLLCLWPALVPLASGLHLGLSGRELGHLALPHGAPEFLDFAFLLSALEHLLLHLFLPLLLLLGLPDLFEVLEVARVEGLVHDEVGALAAYLAHPHLADSYR
mmetsp:Transcript_40106/g.100385  ORF Transcript_40106/g.100385 Transcript_40106/m.100385 type:complete len:244 (+) Transcript_40106:2084-2815(+)